MEVTKLCWLMRARWWTLPASRMYLASETHRELDWDRNSQARAPGPMSVQVTPTPILNLTLKNPVQTDVRWSPISWYLIGLMSCHSRLRIRLPFSSSLRSPLDRRDLAIVAANFNSLMVLVTGVCSLSYFLERSGCYSL